MAMSLLLQILRSKEISITMFHDKMPSKCPPKDAIPANGTFYRVVFNDPPISEDFLIWVIERENLHMIDEKIRKKDCNSFAVSMFTASGISRNRDIFWRGMKKKAERKGTNFLGVAQIQLDPNSGMIKQTGQNPGHFDLWPYTNSKLECNVISVRGI